jgi:predicted anti-sigma-YlaC factor YlaD
MFGAPVLTPTQIVDIDCRHVWKELTNYMEGDLAPELRERVRIHLQGCKHCTAIHDGTRNVVRLLGDEKAIELPRGFSERLFDRLLRDSREG